MLIQKAMEFLFPKLFSSSSSSSCVPHPIILLSALVFLLFHVTQAVTTRPENTTFPAVIVFGDSIVDPGNNNNLITPVKSNFQPYGRDFMGGQPTGRFCNGKIASDFLVEELGIKNLLPAYLDPTLKAGDLLTGVSFASGGSGYDPLTSKIVSVLSLKDQLKLFKDYIGKLMWSVGEERTETILSQSLFLVVAGSDDIANTYFSTPFRRDQYDVLSYTDLMVRSASSFFKELYHLGGRRIGVLGAPPIGCVPAQITLGGGIKRSCIESHNQAARLFNSKLSSEIDSLNDKLPQASLVYIDIYNPLLHLIQNPRASGFEVASEGCCGTGKIEVAVFCNNLNPFTCKDVSKYVFWDSFHPTERAYKTLVSQILRNNTLPFS